MAIVLTIQGIDRTSQIQASSLRIENILTKQVDRCSFKIWSYGNKAFSPAIGREVIITNNGTRVFGGIITRVQSQVVDYPKVEHTIDCMDYTRQLDQHLVAEIYENMTITAIIEDLATNWCPTGILTTNVDEPTIVTYIQFNYQPVSYCLEQLANLVGADWYIDYNKTLYFKQPSSSAAPIDITDSGGVYDSNSLIIRKDTSQLRNSIVVRGGEYLGTEFTASILADGKRTTYDLPYGYDDFKVRVNGVRKTIGLDNIDIAASYDILYNFTEKVFKFRDDNKPAQNATLSFSGKPHLPVIVKLKDQGKINAIYSAESSLGDGKYEYLIIDKSINSKAGARERALAEIRAYGESLVEGSFSTETDGLRAGQTILVNSTALGVNQYYQIQRVVSTMKNPTTMKYDVSLISTKTMDFISVIKKLLLAETNKLEVKTNENVDLVENAEEEIVVTDSMNPTEATPTPHANSKSIDVDYASSQYITFGDVSITDALTAMTIEFWVKVSDWTVTNFMLNKWDENGTNPNNNCFLIQSLDVSGSQTLRLAIASSGADAGSNRTEVQHAAWTANTWYHIALVYDGSQSNSDRIKMYRAPVAGSHTELVTDGGSTVKTVFGTIPTSLTSLNSAMWFGNNGTNSLHGKLDELRIWNKALTITQLDAGLSVELVGVQNNLIGYWRMNDGSGTNVNDEISTNDGTITNGSATWSTDLPFA